MEELLFEDPVVTIRLVPTPEEKEGAASEQASLPPTAAIFNRLLHPRQTQTSFPVPESCWRLPLMESTAAQRRDAVIKTGDILQVFLKRRC